MEQKLFILVRKDISIAQQGVQMAHVAALFAASHKNQDWEKTTFVCCTVEDEEWLKIVINKAVLKHYTYTAFIEPDLDNTITAMAVLHDGNSFDSFPLWNPL